MRGSASLYLLLAIAAYASLAFVLIFSASSASEKIISQSEKEQAQGKLSAACTLLELLSAKEGSAADYAQLEGVRFEGAKAFFGESGEASPSLDCLVQAGAGKIVRVK